MLGGRNSNTCLLQADLETDEVYAQMTLQPLSPVCLCRLVEFMFVVLFHLVKHKPFFVGRAKGCLLPSSRFRCPEQAAYKLFLQNVDSQWHKYSWRIFISSPSSWKSFPSIGKSHFSCYGVSLPVSIFTSIWILCLSKIVFLIYRTSPSNLQLKN